VAATDTPATDTPALVAPGRAGLPPAVRSLLGGLVVAIPVVVIGVLILWLAPPYQVRIAFAGYVNLVIVVGLQIFMGNANIGNFGHSAFVGVGAYFVAILATPMAAKKLAIPNAPFGLSQVVLEPIVAAAASLAVVGVLALATGFIISRLSGIAASIVTLSLLIISHGVFINYTDLFKGAQAFFGIPVVVGLPTAIAVAVVAIVIARMFRDSRDGVQLRASADDVLAARSFGVDVVKLRFKAWVLSALVCGVAGILYAYFMGAVIARAFFFQQVFLTLAMLILGGMRTVSGAVVGCAILSIGLEAIRSLESGATVMGVKLPEMLGLSGLSLGAVIVLGMAFRPNGIMGRLELDELAAGWLRRLRRS
jgi:branched-chain amino acid transport system permease protein